MLTIYTNNEYPNLYDGERLLHVLTGNTCDELHVIVDGTMPEDEVEEEIRLALRRKYGRGYGYEGYEELTEAEGVPFDDYDFEAFLGEFAADYDYDGLVAEMTFIDPKTGNRFYKPEWVDDGTNGYQERMAELLEKHDKTN